MTQIVAIAQWDIQNITKSLMLNSDAVIRRYATDIKIYESDKIYVAEDIVITIIDKDIFERLVLSWIVNDSIFGRYVSVKLYNTNGKKIKSREDLIYDSFEKMNNGKVFEFSKGDPNLMIPFTIELEYKRRLHSIEELRSWIPLKNYRVSIQNASLRIACVDTTIIEIKSTNVPFVNKSVDEDGYSVKLWELNNFQAINKITYEELNHHHQLPTICLEKINK